MEVLISMIDLWMVGAAASVVVLVVYLTVAISIIRRLRSSGQTLGANPLAWATAFLFLTFAVHHGFHAAYQITSAISTGAAYATRAGYDGWIVTGWDVLSAGLGVWYLALRGRLPTLLRGGLYSDVTLQKEQALDVHDSIVQGLAIAKMSFELDRDEEGLAAIEQTLEASRRIITDLLGEGPREISIRPGELRRQESVRGRSG